MGWYNDGFTSEKQIASDYGLLNSKEEIIATEPLSAILILTIIALITLFLGARGIAKRQF